MSRAFVNAPLRSRAETVEKLIDAAIGEFNEHGFTAPIPTRSRTESRLRQIAFIDSYCTSAVDPERNAAILLQLERFSDALAGGEFADMHLGTYAVEGVLTRLVRNLRDLRPAVAAP